LLLFFHILFYISLTYSRLYDKNPIKSDFCHLQQLSLASERSDVGDRRQLLVKGQIDANYSSLEYLVISGSHMLQLPMKAFTHLTRLALYHLERFYEGMDDEDEISTEQVPMVLRHAVNLDTLDIQGGLGGSLFPTLAEDLSILPHLKRLRVMSYDEDVLGEGFFPGLVKFICVRKTSLKSLDVSFGHLEEWDDMSLVLPTFAQVRPEIVGVGPEPEFYTPKMVDTLFEYLPRSIRALRLAVGDPESYKEVMDCLVRVHFDGMFTLHLLME
jgi:hypothetical protein